MHIQFNLFFMTRYILLWFPMLFIAIMNGMLREFVFRKYMGDLTAHQLSTVSLIIFFAVYIGILMKRIPPASSEKALLIGILWMLMTLAFEFGFGAYRGNSWSKMIGDYNIYKGHIWILIPVWVTIAPYIFYKLFQ